MAVNYFWRRTPTLIFINIKFYMINKDIMSFKYNSYTSKGYLNYCTITLDLSRLDAKAFVVKQI